MLFVLVVHVKSFRKKNEEFKTVLITSFTLLLRTKCEICSKLTIKIPERRVVHIEHILHLVLVFLLLALNR